jgi:spermidine synthase
MAFAAFGIITPVLSVVLSVFMLGLAVGSVLGGKWISGLTKKTGLSPIVFYGLAEMFIGLGAFAVPQLFTASQNVLLSAGAMNSFGYLFLSAGALALSILPWCFFMGTTFPLMMAYIRESGIGDPKSFSFLYTANVLGAMSGTILSAMVFIEMAGFDRTLRIAAAGNFAIALVSAWLGRRQKVAATDSLEKVPASGEAEAIPQGRPQTQWIRGILFTTGFVAMAMEVVWTRTFTPVLKTEVYSFASIVFTYLGATFAGATLYRRHLKRSSPWPTETVIAFLIVAAFLPVTAGDPRLVKMDWTFGMHPLSILYTLATICPFCAALGYLTPRLIDDYAGNDPKRAGGAYAINVAGCILGPLFASYILLPYMREKFALVFLALPFLAFYFVSWKALGSRQRLLSGFAMCLIGIYSLFYSKDFQDFTASQSVRMEARRDYAASVISLESKDGTMSLLVNGIGMTTLTPITKYMADLPLAYHTGKPQSVLVICFGMGTTFRSALTWDVDTTAVELIPDVPNAFGFYHADATNVLRNPHGRVVIDDGRRFLKRTRDKYDVIIIDPPPPMEAAGVSLLYSTDMYDLIKQHLKPHGILQVWFPGGPDKLTNRAVLRSVASSFPCVHSFLSIDGWGLHILASVDPIKFRTPAQLIAQMPEATKTDLLEWSRTKDLTQDVTRVLHQEILINNFIASDPDVQITDDDPVNEYFLLRRTKEYLGDSGTRKQP